MKLKLLIASIFSIYLFSCQKENKRATWVLFSPDSSLHAVISIDEGTGSLKYCVLSSIDTVIRKSSLGISRTDQSFLDGLTFLQASPIATIDEKYTMVTGKRKVNRNYAKELLLSFKNKTGGNLEVIFRVYNDGIAFRYKFPESDAKSFTVNKEITDFALPTEGKAWVQQYDFPCIWCPAYENWYRETTIGQNSPDSSGWTLPSLFYANKYYILISESALNGTYFGSRFSQNCEKGIYKLRMPIWFDGDSTGNVFPTSTLPWATPWRTLIISKNPGVLIESNLIHHVAEPQVAGDFSWVKPGRASWSWWSESDSPLKLDRLKEYVDLAKEMNWEYSLVDARWNIMENNDTITDLVKYAQKKNIGIILWYNSGGSHNHVMEPPRDILQDSVRRRAEFKMLQDWGVKAVKIDFFHSDKQNMIQYYLDLLKDAATYHLMVDFHGCTIPRGWPRTYPNLITMESVKGAEQYRGDSTYPERAVGHNTILPYTRNVIGPMDFTPVTFSDYACCPHQTSNANELALSVIFESGIQHFADKVESYRKQDTKLKDFFKVVPSTWDDTKFIEGEPSKLTVLARQKGSSWFVAGANGENIAKSLTLQLPFIKEGKYKITVFADGKTNRDIAITEKEYTSGEPLPVSLLPKGGFVAWIRPVFQN